MDARQANGGPIARDARRARNAGADAVIVNFHWGTEYQGGPERRPAPARRQLRGLKAITAIVGQHVHVVQPIRRIDGRSSSSAWAT